MLRDVDERRRSIGGIGGGIERDERRIGGGGGVGRVGASWTSSLASSGTMFTSVADSPLDFASSSG
jgi:hypothetical protein